jgi:hypothetical protein
MRIHKNQALIAILLVLVFSQKSANPINRHNAIKHAQPATQASNAGDWDLARREWAKAVVNADFGGLDSKKRAVFYYEYDFRSVALTIPGFKAPVSRV